MLENYNDGRRKSFFSIAVNLLNLHDLKNIIEQINSKTACENLVLKEKANVAVTVFQTAAEQKNIVLKPIKSVQRSNIFQQK
ncbi:hypothetical protein [Hydrogenoanaerobacterium saccharovorans]|uniref:hypothetical protein n=1 Tax=Hydrogenoanaerobacterium saccharovorans TaxID=474960 RepID=UPI000F4E09DC|nr:hypothetical protein [Hydrogenoanaerobacterium saccharovorans]